MDSVRACRVPWYHNCSKNHLHRLPSMYLRGLIFSGTGCSIIVFRFRRRCLHDGWFSPGILVSHDGMFSHGASFMVGC